MVSKCGARMKRKTPFIQGLANNLRLVVGKSLKNNFKKQTFTLMHIMQTGACQAILGYYKEIMAWPMVE